MNNSKEAVWRTKDCFEAWKASKKKPEELFLDMAYKMLSENPEDLVRFSKTKKNISKSTVALPTSVQTRIKIESENNFEPPDEQSNKKRKDVNRVETPNSKLLRTKKQKTLESYSAFIEEIKKINLSRRKEVVVVPQTPQTSVEQNEKSSMEDTRSERNQTLNEPCDEETRNPGHIEDSLVKSGDTDVISPVESDYNDDSQSSSSSSSSSDSSSSSESPSRMFDLEKDSFYALDSSTDENSTNKNILRSDHNIKSDFSDAGSNDLGYDTELEEEEEEEDKEDSSMESVENYSDATSYKEDIGVALAQETSEKMMFSRENDSILNPEAAGVDTNEETENSDKHDSGDSTSFSLQSFGITELKHRADTNDEKPDTNKNQDKSLDAYTKRIQTFETKLFKFYDHDVELSLATVETAWVLPEEDIDLLESIKKVFFFFLLSSLFRFFFNFFVFFLTKKKQASRKQTNNPHESQIWDETIVHVKARIRDGIVEDRVHLGALRVSPSLPGPP